MNNTLVKKIHSKIFCRFLQFNPNKPNKFHLKLFMVSEQESGYICGFSIYTGKSSNELVSADATLDKDCSITTTKCNGFITKNKITQQSQNCILQQLLQVNFTIVVFIFFQNIPAYFEILTNTYTKKN